MKQVQVTLGRLVQRIAGKTRSAPSAPVRRPVELDTRILREVAGGTTSTPNKGW